MQFKIHTHVLHYPPLEGPMSVALEELAYYRTKLGGCGQFNKYIRTYTHFGSRILHWLELTESDCAVAGNYMQPWKDWGGTPRLCVARGIRDACDASLPHSDYALAVWISYETKYMHPKSIRCALFAIQIGT